MRGWRWHACSMRRRSRRHITVPVVVDQQLTDISSWHLTQLPGVDMRHTHQEVPVIGPCNDRWM